MSLNLIIFSNMKRLFKIGQKVWYEEDYEKGWGVVILLSGTDAYKEDILDEDDILTVQKEGCRSEIECTANHVYHLAKGRKFRGHRVVWEHFEGSPYPFYCPHEDENCYHEEVE